MDLAQDSVRRLGILDLPEDVLRDIFDYFTDEDLYQNGEIPCYYPPFFDKNDNFRVLQSARLVCRRFYEVASPLLAPVLYVHLNSESLTRIDQLTRNPLIAAGVRLVHLSLEYRPKEVASNLSLYKRLQCEKMNELSGRCDWLTEFSDPDTRSEEDQKIYNAMGVYWDITRGIELLGDPGQEDGNSGPEPDERDLEFRDLARRCFEEYQRRHEDQYRLLMDGSFARTLAASLARMTSLRAVSVVDRFKIDVNDYFGMEDVTVIANDTEKLRQLLVVAEDWRAIEEMSPTPELLPARLLWELPIAMCESGTPLRELSISAMPLHTNFDMLCPRGQDGWDRLRTASRCIRRVKVGESGGNMNCRGIRQEHLPAEEQAHIDNYLGALLSGPCVERVDLDLNSLKLNLGGRRSGIAPKDKPYRIGRALAPVSCPRLTTLYLSTVSLHQEELEGFFRGLGGGLKKVGMNSVGVLGGGWARPLDLLREKLLAGRSPGGCTVRLDFLYGGGFDCVSGYDSDRNGDRDSDSDSDSNIDHLLFPGLKQLKKYYNGNSSKVLHQNAEKYVTGAEGVANPLAELEAGLGE